MPLLIEPADTIDTEALAALFTETFTGYFVPTKVDEPAMTLMTRAFDIDLTRSVIGLEDDRRVAMGLLATRASRGWVAGMGVVPDARGKGHGRDVMDALIVEARAARMHDLDLEVLVQNTGAEHLYASLGFRRVRTLDIWRGTAAPTEAPTDAVTPIAVEAALDLAERWNTEPIPWQRARRTLERTGFTFEAHVAERGGAPVAVLVHRVADNRCAIAAVAAAPPADDGALETLLRHALSRAPGAAVQLLNLPEGDPAGATLARVGLAVELRQYEMRLAL